ncbi:uncharacterized protein LOC112555473 [Pomacea canaliculata]|uniref:uncharacterized protein LOC112555473 n=1 Tax=Pomacea canaliculata TaxID=400727 RepID=UPI000D7283D3|nr:uncharacterized protein LOC112555473 [Pomacea canaliculata]XP_025079692.1 uncharacterized protein LOC112555473 [Pomacea canaliculata]
MEKSGRPKWVTSFQESPLVSAPDFWNSSLNTRKHPSDPAGYKGTAQHETSSTASHSSSTSTVSSERMRARRVVLFIILVIAAFLVAILVGLLVYFLFMTDRPRHRTEWLE